MMFVRRNTMARIPSFEQGGQLPDYIIHSQKYKDIQEMNKMLHGMYERFHDYRKYISDLKTKYHKRHPPPPKIDYH